jgi:dolichyl-phosphate-mannose--protein O-mannosyl transferase
VPWFAFDDRPIFFFYAVTMIPFTVMALALVLGKVLGPARAALSTGMSTATPRRLIGSAVVGAFVVLVVLNFAYIWPILTDQVLPHPDWLSRMWFKSWI